MPARRLFRSFPDNCCKPNSLSLGLQNSIRMPWTLPESWAVSRAFNNGLMLVSTVVVLQSVWVAYTNCCNDCTLYACNSENVQLAAAEAVAMTITLVQHCRTYNTHPCLQQALHKCQKVTCKKNFAITTGTVHLSGELQTDQSYSR